jgi:hypothetical protein
LNLSEQVTGEAFPGFANELLRFAGGEKIGVAESVETRIWTVILDGSELRLVQDDFPSMVSLEAMD